MKAINVDEFRKLILTYEGLTIADIEDAHCDAQSLTGFGSTRTCRLCKPVKQASISYIDCSLCVWGQGVVFDDDILHPCCEGENLYTYDRIETAVEYNYTSAVLLNAFKERAKYMRSILDNLKIEQP